MWIKGERSAYDVTIVCNTDPEITTGGTGSHKTAFFAADKAHAGKNSKFLARHEANYIKFVPLVLETDGAMHKDFERFIGTLATHARNVLPTDANWSTPSFVRYWIARISCAARRLTATRITRDARIAHRLHFNRTSYSARGTLNQNLPSTLEYSDFNSATSYSISSFSILERK
jgi:hypothetical protein